MQCQCIMRLSIRGKFGCADRTGDEKSGILFRVVADGQCLFPAGRLVARAARHVEVRACDLLIRHARSSSVSASRRHLGAMTFH